jgi:uncharacterized protein with PIN domain
MVSRTTVRKPLLKVRTFLTRRTRKLAMTVTVFVDQPKCQLYVQLNRIALALFNNTQLCMSCRSDVRDLSLAG